MDLKFMDLRPNTKLLNAYFDGYKLSPKSLKEYTTKIQPIDKVDTNLITKSLNHSKLLGFHNYLSENNGFIYTIHENNEILRHTLNEESQEISSKCVWNIPCNKRTEKSVFFNSSLKFAGNGIGVISNGSGVLFVLNCNSENWQLIFKDDFLENGNFHIHDAILSDSNNTKTIHVLVVSISDDLDTKRSFMLQWLVYEQIENKWRRKTLRKFTNKTNIQYAGIERSGEAIYVASDSKCRFISDSNEAEFGGESEEIPEKVEKLEFGNEQKEPPHGLYNVEQLEECDLESDKSTYFQRISSNSRKTTHLSDFGDQTVLFSVFLQNSSNSKAFALRHNVDLLVWQPDYADNNLKINHEGTLMAMGYIQASKRNKKFLTCSPDFKYAALYETTGHLFIYTCSEKNPNKGDQFLLNFESNQILGLHASNNYLYLLFDDCIKILDMKV